ncbi:MAG: TerB family tellurite resistance protein [Candidatus Hydrogenedentales bacterium]
MLEKLLELLAPRPAQSPEDQHEVLRLATCVVLLEVAGADDEFSATECEHIIQALRARFELDQDQAEELIQTAQDRRQESSGLWKFTNQINQTCRLKEKLEIIEEVWRVIYADGTLDGHEDYLVHKLAELLNLTHPQLIAAKLKVSRAKD